MAGETQRSLKEIREEIIKWFKNDFLTCDGMPIARVDGSTGRSIGNETLVTELGDYLPFLYYFGEEDFCLKQIEKAVEYLHRAKILSKKIKRPSYLRSSNRYFLSLFPRISESFDYTDMILGLIEVSQMSNDVKKILNEVDNIFLQAEAIFKREEIWHDWYIPSLNMRLPVSSPLNGMFAELLVDMYKLTSDEGYLLRAKEILDFWKEDAFFRRHRIFPIYAPTNRAVAVMPYIKRYLGYSKVTKYNSAIADGFINYYKVTKDKEIENTIFEWVEGFLENFMNHDGSVHEMIIFSKSNVKKSEPELKAFAMIDTFCELFIIFKQTKYLAIAENIAGFWIRHINPKTGLITQKIGKEETYFDTLTDFCVSLKRLHELTGKNEYDEAQAKITAAQRSFHHTPYGYIDKVDPRDGKKLDYTIQTRFSSLALKMLILEETKERIYENEIIHSLLRDR